MRVLAIDHGTVRCGCALSDPSGTVARPLPEIAPPEPELVAELADEHQADRVIVGIPLTPGGEHGSQAELAREFAAQVKQLVDVPVETYDERLTTKMAERSSREGAVAGIDSLAAAHLLESYLASRKGQE